MKKLKILIDINHPGHVHFFKNYYWLMKKDGHSFSVTSSNTEFCHALLKKYGIPFVDMGNYGQSKLAKFLSIPIMDWRMFRIARKFKPDIFLGIGSNRAAHISWLLRKKSLVFDDTLYKWNVKLYLPFVTKVFTPSCIKRNLGTKQIRYNGYHELAYLRPEYFKPNKQVLKKLNIKPNERFFIIRFGAWKAGHDIDAKASGFSVKGKIDLVNLLNRFGKVFITAEGEIPSQLKRYKIKLRPDKIHDMLFFADMLISEGATMASEAAILGTPSIFVSSLLPDTINEQSRYGLVLHFSDGKKALKQIEKMLLDRDLKRSKVLCRQELLKEKIDVTAFLIEQTKISAKINERYF